MKRFFHFVLRHKLIVALLLCAAVAVAYFFTRLRPRRESTNPDVTNPVFAVEYLKKWNPQSLYFTLSAHDYLSAKQPQWIAAHNTPQALLDFYHAGQDSNRWRRLDHEFHFDAVMLCGEPSEYLPLLESLVVTRDWTLVYLDHTSIIFRRGPTVRPWTLQDLQALQQRFANYPAIDRAAFLTECASKLLAIGVPGLAKPQLDESLRLDPDSPATLTQMATFDLQTGKAADALAATDRALKLDKTYYYAITARIHILVAMKRFDDALHVSQALVKDHQDDAVVLYSHAMVAHLAHAYTQEIETLKHLIDIVSAQKQSVAGFRVYLAQAYEMDGQAQPALAEFQKALDEGSLSEEQGKLIETQMKSIRGEPLQ